jgi:hypothetical protein
VTLWKGNSDYQKLKHSNMMKARKKKREKQIADAKKKLKELSYGR